MERQLTPAAPARAEIVVVNSRFIATLAPVFSVEEARAFVARIKAEFAEATHNVPAFVIGHGASVITHCHDDGEPAGTAGRPALAVLQGSGLGDVAVVVTRYFGGTRLGTGGLVRAYGDAVRAVLALTPRAVKMVTQVLLLSISYSSFERVRLLIPRYQGSILEEDFGADITLTARFPLARVEEFQAALRELSRGAWEAVVVATEPATLVPLEE
ncbi:MAG TPA: YigZ family protein [Anaerolineae bacterium]|nr:YigZ family protein [Anaerolineae bacterium]